MFMYNIAQFYAFPFLSVEFALYEEDPDWS